MALKNIWEQAYCDGMHVFDLHLTPICEFEYEIPSMKGNGWILGTIYCAESVDSIVHEIVVLAYKHVMHMPIFLMCIGRIQ